MLRLQEDPGQHSVASERVVNPHDKTSTETDSAGRCFMRSVTIPFQARKVPFHHKTFKTEFKIDYQVHRDNKGQETLYKVYLASTYKVWAIMAEKKDATGPRGAEMPPEISVEAEKPSEDHQEPSAEDPHDAPVPKPIKRSRRGPEYRLELRAKFDAVNGVVLPSTLKPGQPPIKTPYGPIRTFARVRTGARSKCCPICGDWFPNTPHVKNHFVHCVGRNGNPQGYLWNGALNDERRIGKEIAELYCRRDGGEDQDTETSTSGGSSGDDPHIISYVPSVPCSYSQRSRLRSQAATPGLHHDRNGDTGASPQTRTPTEHGYGIGVTEMLDKELADSATKSPHFSKGERAETLSKAAQDLLSEGLRDLQADKFPLSYGKHFDDINRAWILTTPEPAEKHETEPSTAGANGHDDIHGDFDAIHLASKPAVFTQPSQGRHITSNAYILPKAAVPAQTSQGPHTISNAYPILTPRDFGARRLPVPPPDNTMTSLTSPATVTSRQFHLKPKALPSSPPSGAKKRRMPSEPSPLSQSPKRQQILSRPTLPSEEENLLHVRTAADPSLQSEDQGPHISPASAEGSAPSLSRSEPMSGENVDGNHAGVRQSKGAGLRINTKVAESTAPPPPGDETTSGEKLYADYVKPHKEFRKELNNLAHELEAANKRANTAELRMHKAENLIYQANNAGFAKLMIQEDNYKKENDAHRRANRSLVIRCHTLERSMHEKNQELEELKWELGQERQMSANVRSELAKAMEHLGLGPSFSRG